MTGARVVWGRYVWGRYGGAVAADGTTARQYPLGMLVDGGARVVGYSQMMGEVDGLWIASSWELEGLRRVPLSAVEPLAAGVDVHGRHGAPAELGWSPLGRVLRRCQVTERELCARTGWSRSTVQRLKRAREWSPGHLLTLAEALRLEPFDLLAQLHDAGNRS